MSDVNNPHGYDLNEYGEPKCLDCGVGTNRVYADHPNLTCWQCRARMDGKPDPRISQIVAVAKAAKEFLDATQALRKWRLSHVGQDTELAVLNRSVVAEGALAIHLSALDPDILK